MDILLSGFFIIGTPIICIGVASVVYALAEKTGFLDSFIDFMSVSDNEEE